jgi:conserved hypothetical protein, YceG family
MNPRQGPNRRRHRLLVVIGFLVFLLSLGGFVLFVATRDDRSGAPPPGAGVTREVKIPPGVSAEDVARILERQGVIASTDAFLAEVKHESAAGELKPGTYLIGGGDEYSSIIATLRRGDGTDGLRVTIPEGLSIDQTASRLTQTYRAEGTRYASLSQHPQEFSLPPVGGTAVTPATLEGLLFPDTYVVASESGVNGLIQQQLDTFARETSGLPWQDAAALGVDPYEALIVASLIEKEARVPEDRGRIAAVIYNRLAKNMSLGIDATVRYALKKWTGALTKSDLEVASPYNTRKNKGLPPGPVASPGLASLKAALAPDHVPYLYYVLIDANGHHFFTDSYDKFLEAKKHAFAQP